VRSSTDARIGFSTASPEPRASAAPIARTLALIVLLFVGVVACLVLIIRVDMQIMAGVRSYVSGESVWSKAQKDAVQHLQRYADSRAERDWAAYEAAIAVPLGDYQARVALERTPPDLRAARKGLLQGSNHVDDVPQMIMMFRRFGRISYMRDAIAIWGAADRQIMKLRREAARLRRAVHGGATPGEIEAIAARIARLNLKITPVEAAFTRTLGAGARHFERVLLWGVYLAAALLVTLGVLCSGGVLRRVRRSEVELHRSRLQLEEEARVARALARLGRELIGSVETGALHERLGGFCMEVLGCEGSRILLRVDEADSFAVVRTCGQCPPTPALSVGSLAAVFAGSPYGEIAEIRLPDGRVEVALALRRSGKLVGVQLGCLPAGTAVTPEVARIAQGMAHVASLALANAQVVAELDRANQLKSEFVSTMSHELRTPMNVILGYAEMAREADGDLSPAACVSRIEAAGHDLLTLIESTLEIGRIDAGRDEVRLERVGLEALWGALGESCQRLPRAAGVRLIWENAPPIAAVTDPRKLTVVVRNLVGNALKFTEKGSVRAALTLTASHVQIQVVDTGVGIRPEDQATVFEMFRQADGSETRRFGGSGLGLYIVRRFAQQLGGTVALESALHCGSTFTVMLPLARVAMEEESPHAGPSESDGTVAF
jgi:signal transduction histidine kinase